jgi:phosphohistidine phosphatase SixA
MSAVSRIRAAAFFLGLVLIMAFSVKGALADDDRVWGALKQGSKVVLLRHTHVQIREGIGRLAPGNCAEEVNLTPRGVAQAKRIGEAFRAHGIAVGEVLTSPYCRCLDTGRLAFGRATPVDYLKPPGVLTEAQAKSNEKRLVDEIRQHRGPSNLVMITHDLNIANIVLEDTVPMGEFFVLEPHGTDFDVVGKILINDQ